MRLFMISFSFTAFPSGIGKGESFFGDHHVVVFANTAKSSTCTSRRDETSLRPDDSLLVRSLRTQHRLRW